MEQYTDEAGFTVTEFGGDDDTTGRITGLGPNIHPKGYKLPKPRKDDGTMLFRPFGATRPIRIAIPDNFIFKPCEQLLEIVAQAYTGPAEHAEFRREFAMQHSFDRYTAPKIPKMAKQLGLDVFNLTPLTLEQEYKMARNTADWRRREARRALELAATAPAFMGRSTQDRAETAAVLTKDADSTERAAYTAWQNEEMPDTAAA